MKTAPTRIILTIGFLALAGVCALLPLIAASAEPRDVVIVAKQMSFVAAGGKRTNPTIRVHAGERVRITLVNEDSGVDHDLAVPAWSVATDVVQGAGQASVVFRAPEQRGTTPYICSMHQSMMTGIIEVVARGTPLTSVR
jgi:plastocyanin